MILEITGTDGATVKIRNVVCVGELGIKPGNTYPGLPGAYGDGRGCNPPGKA